MNVSSGSRCTSSPNRRIILVSGAPGAGKTTIAIPLAEALGFPLLSKDDIKESLWDALKPPEGDLTWSRRIGGAAMEVLWRLAARSPWAVLEANFRPHSLRERERLAALKAHIVEVHCHCSGPEARRRYESRAATRHPAHVLATLTDEHLAEFDGPMALGPVLDVDTHNPVDLDALIREVHARLG